MNGEKLMYDFVIRDLKQEEVDRATMLLKDMYKEQKLMGMVMSFNENEAQSSIDLYLNSKLHIIKVVEINDNIEGFAAASIIRTNKKFRIDERGFIGFINELYIAKAYRGKKIATELIYQLIEELKKHDVSYVELHVVSGNEIGKNFWNKNGFKTSIEVMYKKI
jgi:ribosomal protein S18 acetylase RimI-like enzyme